MRALAGKGYGEYRGEHCRGTQDRAGAGSADAPDGLVALSPPAEKIHCPQHQEPRNGDGRQVPEVG